MKSQDARNAIDALLGRRAGAGGADRASAGCPVKGLTPPPTPDRARAALRGGPGHGRDGRRRGSEEAAAERHRQAAADQLLGDVVRAVRQRVPGSRSDLSHVQGAQPRVRHRVGQRSGGARRRARVPADAPRLAPQPASSRPRTSTGCRRPSIRRCRRRCRSRCCSRRTATSSIRSSASSDILKLRRAILANLPDDPKIPRAAGLLVHETVADRMTIEDITDSKSSPQSGALCRYAGAALARAAACWRALVACRRRRGAGARRHRAPAAAFRPISSIRSCRSARRCRTSPCRASTARPTRPAQYAGTKAAGDRLREQPLSRLAAVRGPHREALRGLPRARASRSSRSIRTIRRPSGSTSSATPTSPTRCRR